MAEKPLWLSSDAPVHEDRMAAAENRRRYELLPLVQQHLSQMTTGEVRDLLDYIENKRPKSPGLSDGDRDMYDNGVNP